MTNGPVREAAGSVILGQEGHRGAAMLVDEGLEILDEADCWRLLGQVPIGRVAVTLGALPAIFPVNYALDGDSIVFRTGEGTKLAAATQRAVVAFEVDRFDPMEHTGWSVLVVGMARAVTDDDERGRLARLPLAPWAGGCRDDFVRIGVEFLSGRRITHPDDGGD